MANQKRVSLYFNLDIPSEKAMWDFLEENMRKSETIKRILMNEINNTHTVRSSDESKKTKNKNNISKDEILDVFNM